jgi:phosphoheptose isomerase
MENFIKKSSTIKGPLICEIITSEKQDSLFKQGYKKNIINAIKVANYFKMKTFAILGFNGGEVKKIVQFPIHCPVNDMQIK